MAGGCVALVDVGGTTSYRALVAQTVALGLGLGLVVPAMTSVLLGSVDRTWSGLPRERLVPCVRPVA